MLAQAATILQRIAILGAVVGVGAVAGCSSNDDEQALRGAFAEVRAAVDRGDPAALCEALGDAAQRQLGSIGHEHPTTCHRDALPFLRSLTRAGVSRGFRPHLLSADVDGDRALATVAVAPGSRVELPFERADGDWRLASVFAITATPRREIGTPVPGQVVLDEPDPPPATSEASASRAGGAPCGDYEERVDPYVPLRGGCELRAPPTPATLTLQSAFGEMILAECEIDFFLNVDGRGRVGLSRFWAGGGSQGGPCWDIVACERPNPPPESLATLRTPWDGVIGRDRKGWSVLVDLCLETCVGQFEGVLEFALTPAPGDRWRLHARDAAAGTSGLALAGSWDTRGELALEAS